VAVNDLHTVVIILLVQNIRIFIDVPKLIFLIVTVIGGDNAISIIVGDIKALIIVSIDKLSVLVMNPG